MSGYTFAGSSMRPMSAVLLAAIGITAAITWNNSVSSSSAADALKPIIVDDCDEICQQQELKKLEEAKQVELAAYENTRKLEAQQKVAAIAQAAAVAAERRLAAEQFALKRYEDELRQVEQLSIAEAAQLRQRQVEVEAAHQEAKVREKQADEEARRLQALFDAARSEKVREKEACDDYRQGTLRPLQTQLQECLGRQQNKPCRPEIADALNKAYNLEEEIRQRTRQEQVKRWATEGLLLPYDMFRVKDVLGTGEPYSFQVTLEAGGLLGARYITGEKRQMNTTPVWFAENERFTEPDAAQSTEKLILTATQPSEEGLTIESNGTQQQRIVLKNLRTQQLIWAYSPTDPQELPLSQFQVNGTHYRLGANGPWQRFSFYPGFYKTFANNDKWKITGLGRRQRKQRLPAHSPEWDAAVPFEIVPPEQLENIPVVV